MATSSASLQSVLPCVMEFVEQYASSVTAFSSRYNNSNSVSYSPYNLPGHPSKYPKYGDYPDTYILRTYGEWWKKCEGAQRDYMPQDVDDIVSEDYVELSFEFAVIPTSIIIYETYNPGAVVRIFGRRSSALAPGWWQLYEGPPQLCPNRARRFVPQLKSIQDTVNEIRIEFNQSLLRYHTAVDAVLLAGFKPKTELQSRMLENDIFMVPLPQKKTKKVPESLPNGTDYFNTLPHEVVVHIFQYLDLKSLTRCARVNKRWNKITLDPSLYQALSLKKYWNKVDDRTMNYYERRCKNLKKLDMSWCGDGLSESTFAKFLRNCGSHLTHLALVSSKFSTEIWLEDGLGHCKKLKELRLNNCDATNFSELLKNLRLYQLVVLDLTSTKISDPSLIAILKPNRNLRHLTINLCEELKFMDRIAETVSFSSSRLVSFNAWKTTSLTSEGIKHLSRCTQLRELDLGWCLMTSEPGDCLDYIALGCKDLRRLIVSNWRGLNDHHLLGILACGELRELDLMGIKSITFDFCRMALSHLAKLQLLEISFCDGIEPDDVHFLRDIFKHVAIQRSCEFPIYDNWN